MDTDKRFCSIVLDVISAHGVNEVVCSPGSRNAPLLLAASSRKKLRKHKIIDERSAAFFALGISLVSRKPVALICTSGTALLNYAPAVAEAYYAGVPLIVVSADRPQEWIDQDDSQTLRQFEALGNFVKKSYELPAYGDDNPDLQWYANRIANDAMIEATSGKPGPVHINIRLSEPLSLKHDNLSEPQRSITYMRGDSIGNKEILNDLADRLKGKKIMIVAGFMPPDAPLQKVVSRISELPNVVVMAETISNLHLNRDAHLIDTVFAHAEESETQELVPDYVISMGGALVSRKLKEFLRRHSSIIEHWSLGMTHTTVDCFKSLSLRLEVDPARFLRHLYSRLKRRMEDDAESSESGHYREKWHQLRKKCHVESKEYIEGIGWSELKAFDLILNRLPPGCNLFLSNGTSIRYAQLISYLLPHASYCNRGVSGIDGSVSTALGGSTAYKGPTVMICGDMSMTYDIGALGLSEIPESLKIIVIDNDGGGIFRFIPTTSSLEEREEYFCVSPNLPLRQLSEGYGWHYQEVSDEEELKIALETFFSVEGKSILKISFNAMKSAEILKGFLIKK